MNKSLRTKLGNDFADCTKWRLGGSSVCRVHTIRTTHTVEQQLEYKLICEHDPFEPVYKYTLLCGKIVSTLESGTHPPETAKGITSYEVVLVTHSTKNVKTRDDLVDFIIEAETNWEVLEDNFWEAHK